VEWDEDGAVYMTWEHEDKLTKEQKNHYWFDKD
jgi:hypothetical protein